MFKRLYFVITSLLISFIFTAFSSLGYKNTGNYEDIKINETTRQEIESNFGMPFKAGFDNGIKTYNYLYAEIIAFVTPSVRELSIRFNDDDTVKNYSYMSSSRAEKKVIFN